MANAKKKLSGENIPESMRKTEAVKLRLAPETAARLRGRAEASGVSLSDYVTALIPSRDPKLGDRIVWRGESGRSYSGVVQVITSACAVYASVDGKPGQARVDCEDIVSVVTPHKSKSDG